MAVDKIMVQSRLLIYSESEVVYRANLNLSLSAENAAEFARRVNALQREDCSMTDLFMDYRYILDSY